MASLAALTSAFAFAFTAPAAAESRLGWSDARAGLPQGAEVAAIDAGEGVVVAVGRTAGAPLIAEDDGSGWAAVMVEGLPADAALTDVAVDAGQAWAVGSAAGAPVAVHRAAGGGWSAVAVPAGVPALRSVALAPATGTGYAGDAAGTLHAIGAGESGPSVAAQGPAVAGGGAITGIALRGAADGYAVAAPNGLGAGGGIFRLATAPGTGTPALQLMPAARTASGQPAVDVAASAATALAMSSTNVWRLSADGASWALESTLPTGASTPPATLSSLDIAPDGSEAVAGAWGGDGAAWRRDPAAGWLRDGGVDPGPLTAVAARGAHDVFAGTAGGLLRYAPIPEPEPEPTPTPTATSTPEPTATPEPTPTPTPEPSPTPTAEPADEDDGAAPSSPATTAGSEPPAEAAVPTTTQVAPPAVVLTDKPKPPAAKPVLTDVRVSPRPRRLVITFRLTTRAKVAFAAKRGKRVVGRTRTKELRPGRWQVVLAYRGRRVPTRLSVDVKPTKK